MYRHHKKKYGTKSKVFLQSSQIKYSPFDRRDNEYLRHLHEQLKLRNSQEASIALRKKIEEGHARANYQNELDRLTMELLRPNLPHSAKEQVEKRIKELEELTCA